MWSQGELMGWAKNEEVYTSSLSELDVQLTQTQTQKTLLWLKWQCRKVLYVHMHDWYGPFLLWSPKNQSAIVSDILITQRSPSQKITRLRCSTRNSQIDVHSRTWFVRSAEKVGTLIDVLRMTSFLHFRLHIIQTSYTEVSMCTTVLAAVIGNHLHHPYKPSVSAY